MTQNVLYNYFGDVREFHRFFGHSIAAQPKLMSRERAKSRINWMMEELVEFVEAEKKQDITEMADALADLVYFALGTAVEMGIPFDHVWELVHKANMSKSYKIAHATSCPLRDEHDVPVRCTCGAVQYKADGKTAKPEGWKAPDDAIRFLLTR